MSALLEVLLNGHTLQQVLEQSAQARQEMAARKTVRTFKVTNNNGFITTDLYPEEKVVIADSAPQQG